MFHDTYSYVHLRFYQRNVKNVKTDALNCMSFKFIKWQGNICETRAGPNQPQTRRGMFFLQILNIFSMKTAIFGQIDNFRSGVFMTFSLKVIAHTSSSLEKPLFLAILANLTTSGRVFLIEMVKRHIHGPRPFIWVYNQVSMTFRSNVLARTSSSFEKPLFGLFWPIWPFPVGCFWPKWSKGTSTGQDLSFESITKSLWPSVQKF